MYTTFDRDEPVYGRTPHQDQHPAAPESHDLTLGMPALLGIFLAIVIVCGLAFGYGYSVGHHPKQAAAATPPAPVLPAAAPPLEAASRPMGTDPGPQVSGTAKPSPAAEAAEADVADSPNQNEGRNSVPADAPASLAAAGTAPSASSYMVQIAAVVHAPDAEALASALRRDGYNAVVRTEPQDHFLHVQIGPYSTREAARAMRAHLQALGYSPILKP